MPGVSKGSCVTGSDSEKPIQSDRETLTTEDPYMRLSHTLCTISSVLTWPYVHGLVGTYVDSVSVCEYF